MSITLVGTVVWYCPQIVAFFTPDKMDIIILVNLVVHVLYNKATMIPSGMLVNLDPKTEFIWISEASGLYTSRLQVESYIIATKHELITIPPYVLRKRITYAPSLNSSFCIYFVFREEENTETGLTEDAAGAMRSGFLFLERLLIVEA
ncbi:hypothetical protein ACJX0J_026492, partial [Zea mays]